VSRIDDLIKQLAPNGVEFKTLGDVGVFIRGSGLQKSDLTDVGTPAIHYGQIHTFYGSWTDTTKSFTDPLIAARLRRARTGDLIIATTSEDDEAVAKATAWIGDGEVVVSGDAYIYRHMLDPRYVAFFFQSGQFQEQKRRHITGAKVRRISGDALAKIRIPVPPLEIQHEIVRILDNFAELDAALKTELKGELKARQLQYAYYRDDLFTFRGVGVVKRVPMGEVGKFIRGRRFTKNDVVDDGIPSVHYGEIYTTYGIATAETVSHVREDLATQLRYAKPGDVVIAAVGETVEDVGKAVAWLGTTDLAIHDDCFLYRSDVLDPKFVSHYLRTDVLNREKAKYVARAKVKRLSGESLAKLVIPIPSLNEQRRIVAILDKFDALVTELSAALPAELTARRRQYEYHRDRLLTFEELAA
jgi:type I restriction enzyme, S subunit